MAGAGTALRTEALGAGTGLSAGGLEGVAADAPATGDAAGGAAAAVGRAGLSGLTSWRGPPAGSALPGAGKGALAGGAMAADRKSVV